MGDESSEGGEEDDDNDEVQCKHYSSVEDPKKI